MTNMISQAFASRTLAVWTGRLPVLFLMTSGWLVTGSVVSVLAQDERPGKEATPAVSEKGDPQDGEAVKFTDAQLEHFETKIRPLLAKRCFECHGPDADEASGGFRMTSRGALLKGGDSGPAIVPGQPEKSLLIDTINYGDIYEMPPDSKMPDEEIKLLTDWVRQQAPWPKADEQHLIAEDEFDIAARKQEHWCWSPPAQVQPPAVDNTAWPLDDLDRFILAENERLGLRQAPPADRRTWIRRVYFDLIGLPPTPQQIDEFLADDSAQAHEKVVDGLLASPHFGERWARHWMDLIRYAETCGHEFDYPIPQAHLYRDYLIRAFNADVPYDQFVKEQIAGDLMDNPRRHPTEGTNESILGTGFWFFHEATHAPVDVRLNEANHIDNRIDVMSKSFLGLTVACARCHDHKFDAISTEDYYALAGFLQSSRRQLAMLDPQGKIKQGTRQLREVRQKINQQLESSLKSKLGDPAGVAQKLLTANQLQAAASTEAPNVAKPSAAAAGDDMERWLRELTVAQRSDAHPLWLWQQVTRNGTTFDQSRLQELQQVAAQQRELAKWKSDDLENPAEGALPLVFADFEGPDFGGWFVTGEAFGDRPTRDGDWNTLVAEPETMAGGMADSSRLSRKLHGVLRSPTFELQSNAIWYRIKGENVSVRLIIDGYDMDIYNGLLFSNANLNINTQGEFRWVRQAGDIHRYKGHRAHIEIIDQGDGYAVVDRIVFSDGGQPPYVPAVATRLLPAVSGAESLDDFASRYAAALTGAESHGLPIVGGGPELIKQLGAARARITEFESRIPQPVLAQALTDGTPENEYVFVRGNHKNLGQPAERRLLEAIAGDEPIPGSESSSGRWQLANQIATADNPLTARVMVNRLWHHLFGRGIVASTDNFGVLGKRPSNQPLLDYLATEFVADGWSIKRMLKRLVLSQTYRMSSELNPNAVELDPDNIKLHRMSIRRLQAEAIRDAMLAVSGRLDPQVGGPSVHVHLTPFMQGRGRPGRNGPLDGAGRRSLYVEIRRNFLPPMLVAFDMPIPFNSVGRRNQSNVPAQALILMNDPFVVEQAKLWAEQLIRTEPDVVRRIQSAYQQAFARSPSAEEQQKALEFLEIQAAELGVPENAIAGHVELWKDFCHVLFNVKEFIYLR